MWTSIRVLICHLLWWSISLCVLSSFFCCVWVVCFLMCWGFFLFLNKSSFQIYSWKYFLPEVAGLCVILRFYGKAKVLKLDEAQYFNFLIDVVFLVLYLRNPCLTWSHKNFFCSLLDSLQLALIFMNTSFQYALITLSWITKGGITGS